MEELLRNALDDYISVYPTGHFKYLEKYLCISSDIVFRKFITDIFDKNYYGSDIKEHTPLKLVICKEIQNRINKHEIQKKHNENNNSNLSAQAIEYTPQS
jgi:hypothetical protein